MINHGVDCDASSSRGQSGRKPKILNLLNVKFHFLGDYVRHIRFFGTTTDSYSTQLVSNCLVCQIHCSELADTWQGELAHRLIKRFYGLTNKRDPINQIGKKYNRHEALQPSTDPSEVHETKEALKALLVTMQDFISKLRNHLLGRIREHDFDGDTDLLFLDEERNSVCIRNNIIYHLATLCVNYTTYNMRQDFDTINPKTHLFWYAAVLRIFHADVQYAGNDSQDF